MSRRPHKKYERLVDKYEKHLEDARRVEAKIIALLDPLLSEDGKRDREMYGAKDPAWIPPVFAATLDAELAAHEPVDEEVES